MRHIKKLSDLNKSVTLEFAFEQMAENLIREYNNPEASAEYKQLFATNPDIIKLLPVMQVLLKNSPTFREAFEKIWVEVINKNRDEATNSNIPDNLPAVTVENAINALSLTYNGKAIEALAQARTIGEFDPLSRMIKIKGINIFSPKGAIDIGVGAAKIFRYAATAFTKLNHRNTPSDKLKLRVYLDLNDYAQANEVDITSSEARRNFRRKIKNDLEKLRWAGVSGEEKIQGKQIRYSGLNYIGYYDIDGDTIMVEFTLKMAEYLVQLPIMQYPRSLYSLKDREANAFAMAEIMCRQYSIDNNVLHGTHGRLRIETLLKYLSFPSYDELKANKLSWRYHIKEPFINCLDKLYQCGFLKDCGFAHDSGGAELTDKEINNINSYGEFVSLILWYDLNSFEDSATRAKAITEKRTERMQKLQAKRKKKKNLDNQQ